MLPRNYAGYIGWYTRHGRGSGLFPLCVRGHDVFEDRAAVNAFIAKHLDADRVVIAAGTETVAHTLIVIERGRTVHGAAHEGIGTPSVLAAQERARVQEEIGQEMRWAAEEEQAEWEAMPPWEQDAATLEAERQQALWNEF